MKRTWIGIAVVFAVVAGGVGYWLGVRQGAPAPQIAAQSATAADPAKKERKLLYYRNPMGLPDTSPVPKKDPMGMDYIPVYEGEESEPTGPGFKISVDKVQKLGVRTEAATYRDLARTVKAVGTLQVDERRINTVSPKFEGWIERLHVNTTGQTVARGQPLMEVYSPDLVTAQQEYLIAARAMESSKEAGPEIQASMRQLMSGALQRMRNWDISDVELEQLKRDGEPKRMITLRSPVSGVVVEKPATRGMRFMPGEALYQISDLSALWLLADIFEQDLGLVRPGQAARITVNAFPGRTFDGRVAFLYPTVTAETRTGRVRIDLPNTGGLLKPSMYASVELSASGTSGKALAIPDSAVLDSGSSQAVLIRRGEGLFEPRRVKLGTRAEGYVELLDGVGEGEQVVVRANFLIDAESNLKAALGGFASPGGAPDAAATASAAGIHRGKGSVGEVDVGRQKITIDHGPIPSLKWPAMRMEFDVKDKAMLRGIKPGQAVEFGLVQRAPGEFAIESINVPGTPSQKPPADHGSAHKGH